MRPRSALIRTMAAIIAGIVPPAATATVVSRSAGDRSPATPFVILSGGRAPTRSTARREGSPMLAWPVREILRRAIRRAGHRPRLRMTAGLAGFRDDRLG